MLLVIDIGNTNIVLGLFEENKLIQNWRIATKKNKTDDEYGIQFKQLFALADLEDEAIDGAVIACVVPPLLGTVVGALKKYFDLSPVVIGPGTKTGMPILYDNPREVGADRIVNGVAAYHRFKQSCIIVDFGTATTFDCISETGEYLGGVISPGIGISADALFMRASKLPRVEFSAPSKALGKTTVDSMRSGLVYGYTGLVDGMVRRLSGELGGSPKIIATGGQAEVIARHSDTISEVDPTLTLTGLRILYELNKR